MGMDCYSFITLRKPTPADMQWYDEHPFDDLPDGKDVAVRTLSLTNEQHAALNQTLGCELPGSLRQFINTDKLETDFNIPAHYSFDWGIGNLETEDGWVQFSSGKDGAEPLRFDVRSANYLYTDGLFHVEVVARQVGYMRKPFRRNLDEGITRKADGGIVLTADNFAGADINALTTLLGKDAMDRSSKVLNPGDLALAHLLRAHVCVPDVWDRAVVRTLMDPQGLVEISW
jgi:hypothetical protein